MTQEVMQYLTLCLSVNYRDQHLDRFVFLPFSYIYSDLYVDIIVFCSCEYPPKRNDSPFRILYGNKVENRFVVLFKNRINLHQKY